MNLYKFKKTKNNIGLIAKNKIEKRPTQRCKRINCNVYKLYDNVIRLNDKVFINKLSVNPLYEVILPTIHKIINIMI